MEQRPPGSSPTSTPTPGKPLPPNSKQARLDRIAAPTLFQQKHGLLRMKSPPQPETPAPDE